MNSGVEIKALGKRRCFSTVIMAKPCLHEAHFVCVS